MTAPFADPPDESGGQPGTPPPADDDISRRFSDIVSGISADMNWEVDADQLADADRPSTDDPAQHSSPATILPAADSDDPAERRRRRREERKMERSEEVLAFKAEQARREAEYAEDTEHFVPDEPPPLRWPRVRTSMAVLSLVAGFFLLLGPNVLSISPDGTVILAASLIALGVGILVAGLRRHHEPGEGWDDGSRL